MIFLRRLLTGLLLLPCLTLAPFAQEAVLTLPDPLNETVSDFASALNATEEGRISRLLAEIREETGIHLVVVTAAGIESLGGGDMRLEEYGRALLEGWGIGDKDRNDGILILIDTAAREARITLGSGYEAVYDERAARVLSSALLPRLRQEGMAAGIEAGILSSRDRLIAPFLAGEPVTANEGFPAEPDNLTWRLATGAAALFGFLGISVWRRARSRKRCPNCRALTLTRSHEVITAPTKYQNGVGIWHLECRSCGFSDRQSHEMKFSPKGDKMLRDERLGIAGEIKPEKARTGRNGGFDGGKSDGGGAGGKW